MKLFKRNMNALKNRHRNKIWTDKAAEKIAIFLLGTQEKFSSSMNRIVSKMPVTKLKIALLFFCLLGGGFSIYLVVISIVHPDPKGMKVNKIEILKHTDQTIKIPESSIVISDEMYKNIQGYKRYMDSLGLSIPPGLMDSIKVLEDIYHSQK
jgi:hypothetical protein